MERKAPCPVVCVAFPRPAPGAADITRPSALKRSGRVRPVFGSLTLYATGGIARAVKYLAPVALVSFVATAKVWDIDQVLEAGPRLGKSGSGTSASAVQEVLPRLKPGDALRLSRRLPLGNVVVGDVSPDVEVSGGYDGSLVLRGSARRWSFVYAGANTDLVIEPTADLEGSRFFCSFAGRRFVDHSPSAYEAVAPGFAPRLAKASVDSRPDALGIKWGTGVYVFDAYGSKVTWMPGYYVDGAGARNETETPQVYIKGATDGGKWLFAIEAEQGAKCPAVKVENSTRLQLYSGSTEGDDHETGALYSIINSNQVVLGMRRFYANHKASSTWSGTPQISLKIDGGNGNIIHNLVDIADPIAASLVSTDPSLQIWQTFLEDIARIESGTFQYMTTHQGMINQVSTWTEPMLVDQEVVLKRGGTDLLLESAPSVPPPPAFDHQPWMAKRPQNLTKTAGRQAVTRRFRSTEGFGAALLAAGADPTGLRCSDAAFARLLSTDGLVEVGAGTYRLAKPLALRALAAAGGASTAALLGAGPDKTVIVADQSSEAVIDLSPAAQLRKTGIPGDGPGIALIDGIGVRGGQIGVRIVEGVSTIMSDFAIEGAAKACIQHEAYQITVPAEGAGCGSDGNCADMHLYENGSMSGGDYGIYYTAFADKQGIRNITFSNHNKAGICARNNNLFHGWIGGCKFQNVNGPGVDLSGGAVMPPAYGNAYYTQWVTMVEGCQFTECGNATRPAMDFGFTDINMFCNSSITTKNKDIRYGFLGSVAEISNVTIDVKSPMAIAIRNCRATDASRTPGSIVHTVDTKGGKLVMVDGFPAGDGNSSTNPLNDMVYAARVTPSWDGSNHAGRKWWKDGYEWAFTLLVYKSNLDGKAIDYEIRNAKGYAKNLVTGEVWARRETGRAAPNSPNRGLRAYDIFGRRIPGAAGRRPEAPAAPTGLYILKSDGAPARCIGTL